MKKIVRVLVYSAVSLALAVAHQEGLGAAKDLDSHIPAVRAQAARSLGRAGDRSAVPALIEALRDHDSDVCRETAKALGFLKDERAVEPLIAALSGSDKNLRHYAAYALGEIKDGRAVEALLAALRDPEWCVRDQAAWALREIADPAMVPSLAKAMAAEGADLKQLVWILEGVPDADVATLLVELLEDEKESTRLRAIKVLGAMQVPRAFDALIAALEDPSVAVRRAAVERLAEIGDRRAQEPLAKLSARESDLLLLWLLDDAIQQMCYVTHMAAHWSFDDGSTTVARDATGNGNDGQIIKATPVRADTGAAMKFGPGSYVELGKPAGLPIGNVPFTVMAIVKSDVPRGVVVARGGAFCGFSLYLLDSVAKFGIHRTQDGPTYIAAGKENVVGRTVHLTGVVRKDRIELYVDGKLAATTETSGYIPGNCGQGMEIGYDAANSPAEITDHFQGIIDEVKCFSAGLSADDIAEEFVLPKHKRRSF